jgi:cobalt/nickel transport system permease protein
MRRIEESACLSRFRERTLETCVLCAGLALCSLAIPSPSAGLSVLVAALLSAKCAGVPLKDYLRALLAASSFAMVSILPLSVAVRTGPPSLAWDPSGFRTGILAATRAVGTLSATLLLAFTTPFPRMLSLLRWMRAPSILTDLLSLVHREIFLLEETFSRLRKALACRGGWNGAKAGGRSLSLGMAALFVQALDHSSRLESGLASRGAENGEVLFWDEAITVRPAALAVALAIVIALERACLGL